MSWFKIQSFQEGKYKKKHRYSRIVKKFKLFYNKTQRVTLLNYDIISIFTKKITGDFF